MHVLPQQLQHMDVSFIIVNTSLSGNKSTMSSNGKDD